VRILRFAQLSDLHLGRRLTGGRLGLPRAKAARRTREQRDVLRGFCQAAQSAKADLALMPGDVFDLPDPDAETVNFVIECVNRLAPTPVLITPGNHDYFGDTSPYNPESALWRGRGPTAPQWGPHVHIFREERFETVRLGANGDVLVTGAAFHRHTPAGKRPLAELSETGHRPSGEDARAAFRILLFHGSLEAYDFPETDEVVLPFSREELAASPCDYAAVGHYHRSGLICSDDGRVLGAYTGSPFAGSVSEQEPRRFILGTLRQGQAPTEADITFEQADARRMRQVEATVTGISNRDDLDEAARRALDDAGCAADDLVLLALTGRLARGVPPRIDEATGERYFHLAVEDRTAPDYEVDWTASLPAEAPDASAEEMFKWHMVRRFQSTRDKAERERIKRALWYGLDALLLDEVTLR